jgi:hypothetical protein
MQEVWFHLVNVDGEKFLTDSVILPRWNERYGLRKVFDLINELKNTKCKNRLSRINIKQLKVYLNEQERVVGNVLDLDEPIGVNGKSRESALLVFVPSTPQDTGSILRSATDSIQLTNQEPPGESFLQYVYDNILLFLK